jgi:ATP-dependent RNA helicase RhlE
MPFSSLGLSNPLLNAIKEQGYEQPYLVQLEAIPAILKGRDVFGVAPTGSGKTAGFVLPILELLQKSESSKNRHARALVLVPTRELAMQIEDVFKTFGKHLPKKLKTMAVYGGVSINPQMMQLNGIEILIATPGRLLDLNGSKAVGLSEVEILVLDEADKMLNLGFKEEMATLFALLPKKRQHILFSATLRSDVEAIEQNLLHDPVKIEVKEKEEDLSLITQEAYFVDLEKKGPLLRYLIKHDDMKQVLVFTSSTMRADAVALKLRQNGIDAETFHGKMSQPARTEALEYFKKGRIRVLVATDLASRGIDIKFLPYVINYELPRSPKDYVHRIGRTGRAESQGKAISLIAPDDKHHFKVIQKKMGRPVQMINIDGVNLKGY